MPSAAMQRRHEQRFLFPRVEAFQTFRFAALSQSERPVAPSYELLVRLAGAFDRPRLVRIPGRAAVAVRIENLEFMHGAHGDLRDWCSDDRVRGESCMPRNPAATGGRPAC